MKKAIFILLLFMSIFVFGNIPEANAQPRLVIDSLVYGDSAVTVDVSGYDEFYIDLYNPSDSTNIVAIYDYNYNNWLIPVYTVATTASYNWSASATISLATTAKGSYKLLGGGFKYLRIQLTTAEGSPNRVDFVLKGMRKLD